MKEKIPYSKPAAATEILADLNLTIGDLRAVDIALNGERLQTLNIRGRSRQYATMKDIRKFLEASPSRKK